MQFFLTLSDESKKQLSKLKKDPANSKRYKAVIKTLKLLENNPRHPGLNTHEYTALSKEFGRKVFEAYAENRTPSAYRIFWCYGEQKGEITILTITPHP